VKAGRPRADVGGGKAEGIRGRFSDPFLFPVEKAVDDSVWDSGESGKLSETCSKVATGKYNLAT